MYREEDFIPENNIVILFLLMLSTGFLYYFWWLTRISKLFDDNHISNIMLVVFTFGLWSLYLDVRYLQKSEELNGRDMKWYMIFFLPISVLIIQNNINEKYYPGR